MKKILLSIFLWGLISSAFAQIPSYVPTNSLIGYFGFDSNANDAISSSNPSSNNATSTSDRYGVSNSAYQFNNSNVIKYTNSNTPMFKVGNVNSSFSINLWVNSSSNGGMMMGAYGWGYMVKLDANNKIEFAYISSNSPATWSVYTSKASISKNTWQMVTITRDGNTNSIYIDGVLDNTITSAPNILVYSNNNCWFGANGQDNNSYFTGKIDDIGLWGRGLTKQEITTLYNYCLLTIATEPNNQSSNINGKAQFSAIASDTTASYQWQSNQSNLGWVYIPSNSYYSGVGSKNLTVGNIKLKNHEQLFRVIAIKNNCNDTSKTVTLTVTDTCINIINDTVAVQDTLIINAKLTGTIPLKTNLIKVYPNPAKDYLVIDFGNYTSMAGYSITIFDVAGKSVYSSAINKASETIDLNTWTGKGVYFIKIYNKQSQQIENRKIVIL